LEIGRPLPLNEGEFEQYDDVQRLQHFLSIAPLHSIFK
jgi:hypothetical protein